MGEDVNNDHLMTRTWNSHCVDGIICSRRHKKEMTWKERNARKAHLYNKEFQDWFKAGLRFCDKHNYPFAWHLLQAIDCPKCAMGEQRQAKEIDWRQCPDIMAMKTDNDQAYYREKM